MGTQDNNSLLALIAKLGIRIGKAVINDSTEAAATASTPIYIDSSSNLAQGNIPFTFPIVANATSTTQTFLSLTGSSSESGTNDMGLQLVKGSDYTTFTKSGAIKITVTDSAGNLVNGDHYIQIGTLS